MMASARDVEMPAFAGKHLMRMMRGHLETLQDMTYLLSRHEYEKAAAVAEEGLGMSSAEMHFKMYVGKYLPRDMRAQGKRMHEAASHFAKVARNAAKGDALDKALAAMAKVVKQCVACHSAYRVRRSED